MISDREIDGLNSLALYQGGIVLEWLQRAVRQDHAIGRDELLDLIRGTRNFLSTIEDLAAALKQQEKP